VIVAYVDLSGHDLPLFLRRFDAGNGSPLSRPPAPLKSEIAPGSDTNRMVVNGSDESALTDASIRRGSACGLPAISWERRDTRRACASELTVHRLESIGPRRASLRALVGVDVDAQSDSAIPVPESL
jgi:hypothetical protein